MGGTLFDEIVFGPVKSRRFGISLGINLLPLKGKLCSFNCIYCECGLNETHPHAGSKLYTAEQIRQSLHSRFEALKANGLAPDSLTFAGNGEPTLHPEFETIISDTILLRNEYFPKAKITVLSNATCLHKENIIRALKQVDNNVLKLDAGSELMFRAINRPSVAIDIATVTAQLRSFNGNVIIQTMLVRGEVDGQWVDNTTETELNLWLQHVVAIHPRLVMLYPIDRLTPYQSLQKVPENEFAAVAESVRKSGIKAEVYY
jgi:wyosine [tRNA(Phe)-imidazoG37] synthetase (radical SAM superfamily)